MALRSKRRLFARRHSAWRWAWVPGLALVAVVGVAVLWPEGLEQHAGLPECDNSDVEATVARLVADVAGSEGIVPARLDVRQTGVQATGPTVTTRSCIAEAVVDSEPRSFRFDLVISDNALGFLLTAVNGPIESRQQPN